MENILELVLKHEALSEEIRSYLYPRLYKLYDDKLLNKGELPSRKTAQESVSILEFYESKELVIVSGQIWWGGDIYDDYSIARTSQQWDEILTKGTK